jgi:hypothetical protein
LYLHIIPFTVNVNGIYEYIRKLTLTHGFHLFFLHQDFDIIENRLMISQHEDLKVLSYDKISKLLVDTGRYFIIDGHYHKHLMDKNKKI